MDRRQKKRKGLPKVKTIRLKQRKPPWLRKLLLTLSILAGLVGIWSGYVVYGIEKTIGEAIPRQADVGIVLGAAVWGDGPSPGLRERLDQALWLYQKGYVPLLLVSGGLGEGKRLTEAAVMRDYLEKRGVPSEHILMEAKSTSTYENLLYSQQVMVTYGLKTALIISHDYHLARAAMMADSLGMSVSPVGVHSQVLFKPYHEAREVLATSYWHLSRLWSLALQTVILA